MRRTTTAPLLALVAACSGGAAATSATGSSGGGSSSSSSGGPTSGGAAESTTSASASAAASSDASASASSDAATDTSADTEGTSGGWLTRCPTVAAPAKLGQPWDPTIDEASGLVASRAHAGALWTHNDSGDAARLFALSTAGASLGTFEIVGATAHDWEDIALGPGPTPGDFLYIGDIGDNPKARPHVTVYRLPEPDIAAAGGAAVEATGAEAITLTYPGGPEDAEALLIDPISGDLFIVTKGDTTRLLRHPAPLVAGGPFLMQEIAPIQAPIAFVTAGEVSPRGDFVALRTYGAALLWLRPRGGAIADALQGPPCTLSLAAEIQGEALGIASDSAGYFTVSEKVAQLWWFAFQ